MAKTKKEEKIILLKKFEQGKDISVLAQLLEKRSFYVGETQFRDRSSIKGEILKLNTTSSGYVKLFRNGEFAEIRSHSGSPEISDCSVKVLALEEVTPREIDWLLS